MKKTRNAIGISLDIKLIHKIDMIRGLIPRSRFIEKTLLEKFGD